MKRNVILSIMVLSMILLGTEVFGLSRHEASAYAKPASSDALPREAAIVIDDFGSDMKGTKEMMELPIPFTAAVMPFLPTTKRDAEWAHSLGRDVIIHMPMEPFHGPRSWLGPGVITTDLSDVEIRNRVEAAIADVPYAVGMNNHMGSKATADKRVMRIVLEVCREKGLFFLDSRTNHRSVIEQISKKIGVKTVNNHLFFDDMTSKRHIRKQVVLFKQHLHEHSNCVAIGHVGAGGPNTAAVLKSAAPELIREAKLVNLSELIRRSGGLPEHFVPIPNESSESSKSL